MLIGSTTHYRINSSDSEEEYRSLLPSGGHLVHIGKEKYTVTLFHQLKCLDVIRQEYLNDASQPISSLTRHCMNYLRQSLLCNLNTGLENAKNSAATASRTYNTLCFDWTQVYSEAEQNFKAHSKHVIWEIVYFRPRYNVG
ncbi:hypothetical protein JR316_0009402 [Psilocybe cubensis]|nr:hypothetical protein JR316_0009402 [Psilocybe cubensis]KAH9478939.1 hypothetical protein JR316_0009402 [Psilocybe cubensis]